MASAMRGISSSTILSRAVSTLGARPLTADSTRGGCHLDAMLDAGPGPLHGVLGGLPDSRNNPLAQLVGHHRSRAHEGIRLVLNLLFPALGPKHDALHG